jgi:hypothetical protein
MQLHDPRSSKTARVTVAPAKTRRTHAGRETGGGALPTRASVFCLVRDDVTLPDKRPGTHAEPGPPRDGVAGGAGAQHCASWPVESGRDVTVLAGKHGDGGVATDIDASGRTEHPGVVIATFGSRDQQDHHAPGGAGARGTAAPVTAVPAPSEEDRMNDRMHERCGTQTSGHPREGRSARRGGGVAGGRPGRPTGGPAGGGLTALAVPDGVSFLVPGQRGSGGATRPSMPRLVPHPARGEGGTEHAGIERVETVDGALDGARDVVLETVTVGHRPALLLCVPDGVGELDGGDPSGGRDGYHTTAASRVRVNGQPAPAITMLRLADQIELGDGTVLHVSIHHRPLLGPPPARLIGKSCPVCLVPFESTTRVYVCPYCESAMHLEVAAHRDGSRGRSDGSPDGCEEHREEHDVQDRTADRPTTSIRVALLTRGAGDGATAAIDCPTNRRVARGASTAAPNPAGGAGVTDRAPSRDAMPDSGRPPHPDRGGEDELLRCATLGASCPVCGEPVRMREGLLYLPDDDGV